MAAEERAYSEFINILRAMHRQFDIMQAKWSENKFFEIKFRSQIPKNNDNFNDLCDEWVDVFSEVTNTVWAKKISNTGPKIRFRKQYQCWTHGGKQIQKELLFDARRCKATLDLKVLADTMKKNRHVRLGLNVVVKLNFYHLHPVDTTRPMAFFVHNCEPLSEAPKPQVHPNDRLQQRVAAMVQKGLKASSAAKAASASCQTCQMSTAVPCQVSTAVPCQTCQMSTAVPCQVSTAVPCQVSAVPVTMATKHDNITIIEQPMRKQRQTAENADAGNGRNNNDKSPPTIHILQQATLLPSMNFAENSPQTPALGAQLNLISQQHQQQQQQQQLPSTGVQSQTIQLVPLQDLDGIKLDLSSHLQQYTTQLVVSEMPASANEATNCSEPLLMCQSLMFDGAQVIPVSAHTIPSSHFLQIQNLNGQ